MELHLPVHIKILKTKRNGSDSTVSSTTWFCFHQLSLWLSGIHIVESHSMSDDISVWDILLPTDSSAPWIPMISTRNNTKSDYLLNLMQTLHCRALFHNNIKNGVMIKIKGGWTSEPFQRATSISKRLDGILNMLQLALEYHNNKCERSTKLIEMSKYILPFKECEKFSVRRNLHGVLGRV